MFISSNFTCEEDYMSMLVEVKGNHSIETYIKSLKKEPKVTMTNMRWLASYPLYYMSLTYTQRRLDKKFTAAILSGELANAKKRILSGSKNNLTKEEIMALSNIEEKSFIDSMNFLMGQVVSFKVKKSDKDRSGYNYLKYLLPSPTYYYEDIAIKGIAEAFQALRDQKSKKAEIINQLYLKYKEAEDSYELQVVPIN